MLAGGMESGAADPGAVTLPAGNVARLEAAWRITPERTERADLYQEKLEGLACADRGRVEAMEALLFVSAARAGSCTKGDLPIADRRFDCADGQIWFYYSSKRRKFILAEFGLHDRGIDSGSEGAGDDAACPGRRYHPGLAAGVAACLSRLLTSESRGGDDVEAGEVEVRDIRLTLSMEACAPDRARVGPAIADRRGLVEIARGCWSLGHAGGDLALPYWSTLAGTARVREELENPYARAIFAGEALCRLGAVICSNVGPDRPFLLDPTRLGVTAKRVHGGAALLRESAAILAAIRDSDAAGLRELRHGSHYLTSPLMDPTIFADARRLALVRSEMTFRLALVLTRRTERGRASGPVCVDRSHLRRYAMLNDFVRISATYFSVSGRCMNGRGVASAAEGRSTDNLTGTWAIMRAIEDFGCSMTIVVDQLNGPDHLEVERDVAVTCRNLVTIATEILK